jgi:hypothetical protein
MHGVCKVLDSKIATRRVYAIDNHEIVLFRFCPDGCRECFQTPGAATAIVYSGREGGYGNIHTNDPEMYCHASKGKAHACSLCCS